METKELSAAEGRTSHVPLIIHLIRQLCCSQIRSEVKQKQSERHSRTPQRFRAILKKKNNNQNPLTCTDVHSTCACKAGPPPAEAEALPFHTTPGGGGKGNVYYGSVAVCIGEDGSLTDGSVVGGLW